jgi:hypothetical protein
MRCGDAWADFGGEALESGGIVRLGDGIEMNYAEVGKNGRRRACSKEKRKGRRREGPGKFGNSFSAWKKELHRHLAIVSVTTQEKARVSRGGRSVLV